MEEKASKYDLTLLHERLNDTARTFRECQALGMKSLGTRAYDGSASPGSEMTAPGYAVVLKIVAPRSALRMCVCVDSRG